MNTFKPIFIVVSLVFTFTLTAFAVSPHDLDMRELIVKIPFEKIALFEAWSEIEDRNPTFASVIIGIVDTGVATKHPEFSGDEIDGIARGAVDFGSSSFFAKRDGDADGHGTQVAGIIGASNIAPFATLPSDSPQTNGIVAGVTDNYVLEVSRPLIPHIFAVINNAENIAKKNVEIVNIGFTLVKQSVLRNDQKGKIGGEVSDIVFNFSRSEWGKLFNEFPDTLFIIPAGNSDTDVQNETPSNFSKDFLNVIAVGALDGLSPTDERDVVLPEGSNFGEGVVVAAPGTSIYAPQKFSPPLDVDDYDTNFSGTSASAPMVTGVAGLLKAINPDLTPAQIKSIITTTADPLFTTDPAELSKTLGSACDDGSPSFRGCRLNAREAVCHPSVLNCEPSLPTLSCPLASGVIAEDSRIPLSESPCVVTSNVTVPNDVSLTVDPGVILKFASPSAFFLINGTLSAEGTASSPIIFTSLNDDTVGGDTNNDGGASVPAPGDWNGVVVQSGGSAIFTHSVVRYGGHQDGGISLGTGAGTVSITESRITQNRSRNVFVGDGTVTITGSEVDNANVGIFQSGGFVSAAAVSFHDHVLDGINSQSSDPGVSLSVHNSTFTENGRAMIISPAVEFTHAGNTAVNNTFNGIVMNGTTAADRVWTRDLTPYIVFSSPATSTVTVAAGDTLTIDSGTVLKFAFPSSIMFVNGTLEVNGTVTDPVFFTSIKDDAVGGDTNNDGEATSPAAGDWHSIIIQQGGAASFSHSTIRYGGHFENAGISVGLGAQTISLTATHLTENLGRNLFVRDGTVTITGSEVDTSNRGIVGVGGTTSITGSSIHGHTEFGVFSEGPLLKAEGNWWGDPSGPFHPTENPDGLGNAVSDNVDFEPFLTSDPVGDLP